MKTATRILVFHRGCASSSRYADTALSVRLQCYNAAMTKACALIIQVDNTEGFHLFSLYHSSKAAMASACLQIATLHLTPHLQAPISAASESHQRLCEISALTTEWGLAHRTWLHLAERLAVAVIRQVEQEEALAND